MHLEQMERILTIGCGKDVSKSSESDSSALESGSESYEGSSDESRTDNTSES